MDPTAFVYMALSAEREFGGDDDDWEARPHPGVVVVDAAACHAKYTPIDEVQPEAVRTQLREQMRPGTLYVVSKTAKHLHVFAFPRARALAQLRAGTLPAPT